MIQLDKIRLSSSDEYYHHINPDLFKCSSDEYEYAYRTHPAVQYSTEHYSTASISSQDFQTPSRHASLSSHRTQTTDHITAMILILIRRIPNRSLEIIITLLPLTRKRIVLNNPSPKNRRRARNPDNRSPVPSRLKRFRTRLFGFRD